MMTSFSFSFNAFISASIEIDHFFLSVFINSKRELMSGDFVNVKITGSNEYDLTGEMEDER